MQHARRAGKRDAIEAAVISVARRHGWLVLQLDAFDLLCCRGERLIPVEVKTGNKPLTVYQEGLVRDGWPLVVVRSVEEAEGVFA